MRNILLIVFLLIQTTLCLADDQPVRALMTIHGGGLESSESEPQIPSLPANDDVKRTLSQLVDGDEVMIEGRIHQETTRFEESTRTHSYLIIDSIHKVSLAELGDIKFKMPESSLTVSERPYSPIAIPVTAEVATAMTMTTSMLLLENLSSSPDTDPEGRRQVRQSIMLSAGLMATIIFIYEQLNGSSKP